MSSLLQIAITQKVRRISKNRFIVAPGKHFTGRKRNVYRLAIVAMQRALQRHSLNRVFRKRDMEELWVARTTAGCEEHGLPYRWFHEGLAKANVLLNRKVLSELAAWEPRTFAGLTKLAWHSVKEDGRDLHKLGPAPEGVFVKGKLHKE